MIESSKVGRKHLKVSRQRKDFAIKTAPGVVKSSDFVAYENLQVRNMVKNHKLAKSISDAAWSQFAQWLQYLGKVYGKTVVAVAPQYTSQDCSSCGNRVQKSLSIRTHKTSWDVWKLSRFSAERKQDSRDFSRRGYREDFF